MRACTGYSVYDWALTVAASPSPWSAPPDCPHCDSCHISARIQSVGIPHLSDAHWISMSVDQGPPPGASPGVPVTYLVSGFHCPPAWNAASSAGQWNPLTKYVTG